MSKSWYRKFYENSLAHRNLKIKDGNWHNIVNCLCLILILCVLGIILIFSGFLLFGILILILILGIGIWQEKNFFEEIKPKA